MNWTAFQDGLKETSGDYYITSNVSCVVVRTPSPSVVASGEKRYTGNTFIKSLWIPDGF